MKGAQIALPISGHEEWILSILTPARKKVAHGSLLATTNLVTPVNKGSIPVPHRPTRRDPARQHMKQCRATGRQRFRYSDFQQLESSEDRRNGTVSFAKNCIAH